MPIKPSSKEEEYIARLEFEEKKKREEERTKKLLAEEKSKIERVPFYAMSKVRYGTY